MRLGVAGAEDWRERNDQQLIHEAHAALYRAKSLEETEWCRRSQQKLKRFISQA